MVQPVTRGMLVKLNLEAACLGEHGAFYSCLGLATWQRRDLLPRALPPQLLPSRLRARAIRKGPSSLSSYTMACMDHGWSSGYAMKFPLCRTQQDWGIKDIRDSALQYKVKID